jgi:ribosomal protein L19E
MRTHIDWLTFSARPWYEGNEDENYTKSVTRGLDLLLGEKLHDAVFVGAPEIRERSRAPYKDAWTWDELGITLFASKELNHFTVEISGIGCERLIACGLMVELLEAVKTRVTRLDVACDVETETTPEEFVAVKEHERMRSSGHQSSKTGETQYVGSQKSDRYARVYRYNPPHPRSHLLRIEHVFRADYAKKVAEEISNYGLDAVAAAAGKAFGWKHRDWNCEKDTSADLSIVTAEKEAGKTVFWLINSAAPAFKRLVNEGAIKNPRQFITDYFFDYQGD